MLTEALKIYDIEIEPTKKTNENFIEADKIEAFIFNSSSHWFAIRKIDNIWFNLNSTNKYPGPQIISDFYLSTLLKSTEEYGYTNFIVKNLLPLPELDSKNYKNLQAYQKLVDIDTINKNKPDKINIGDGDDDAIEKAIKLSKQDNNAPVLEDNSNFINPNEQAQIEEDELNAAIQLSLMGLDSSTKT